MPTYAKRTCNQCGIIRPLPDMVRVTHTPVSVNGRLLAPREVLICPACDGARRRELAQARVKRIAEEVRATSAPEAPQQPPAAGQEAGMSWLVAGLVVAFGGAMIAGAIWLFSTYGFGGTLAIIAGFSVMWWLWGPRR